MESLDEIVHRYDEILALKEKQGEALEYLAQGKGDLKVSLPVGYGKSLIFHVLPDLLGHNKHNPVVLVVSPWNLIQKDQLAALSSHNISCCRLDIKANVSVDDGEDTDDQHTCSLCYSDASLEHLKQGKFKIILSLPEALLNTRKGRDMLKSDFPQHAVVVDECHVIDKWGEEFRTAFESLKT